MNIERINDYVDAYSKAINITPEITNILKELIPNLVKKYSKCLKSIPQNQDMYDKYVIKSIDGKYSLENFFLNRLFRNVWAVNFNSNTKGHFDMSDMSVNFNMTKIDNQLKMFSNISENDFIEFNNIARKKVIMHEFEHALQTQYSGELLDMRYKIQYQKIFEEIIKIKNGKYAYEINSYDDINKNKYGRTEEYTHSGLHYSYKKINVKTYRDIEGYDNLNEIFNETESLEMARAKVQAIRNYKNEGTYYTVRNAESSNMSITNYGDLIKTLLGEKETFVGIYLNPDIIFKKFNNRYDKIFQEVFENGKSAWENLIRQIKIIKDNDTNEEHLKLDTALAKCLKLNINKQLGKVDTKYLKYQLLIFRNNTISSEDKDIKKNLKHVKILDEIEEKIVKQEKCISDNMERF